jgi:hypothetical protein
MNSATKFFVIIALVSSLSIITIMLPVKNVNAWHDYLRGQQPGGSYQFNGNGYPGELFISNVNGMISGTVYGERIIGFWDETTHKIIFMRMTNEANPYTFQVYKGFMFKVSERNPSTGVVFCYSVFTGEFLTPGGGGGSPQRNEFGWLAKQGIVCD